MHYKELSECVIIILNMNNIILYIHLTYRLIQLIIKIISPFGVFFIKIKNKS